MSTPILNKKSTILFWDDEAEGRKELLFTEIKQGLERYGWTTRIFTDNKAAKKEGLESDIDAIVLDLKEDEKPVGLEILRYLRERRPFLPIVMFTIYSEIENIQSAMKEDVSYYLTMPVKSYHDVIRAIEVAVEREKAKERFVQDRYYASIGKLAAGVAHFIKNSLWNISGRSQFLLEKTDINDESYKHLETINRRCDEANKVVINLLNFARREPQTDEKKELNIVSIIENVLKLVSYEIEYYKISEIKNILCRETKVNGNEFDLKEAFLNIIKNAIEAMPDGGDLSINVKSKEKDIIITISDTGEGMTEEILKNIFMPYYTTKNNSAGFGLFDSRRIIHNHKGTLKVDSKPGKGTVFKVTFPQSAIK